MCWMKPLPFILREIERSYTDSKGFVCILQLKIMCREDFNFAVESTCYNILAISTETHLMPKEQKN